MFEKLSAEVVCIIVRYLPRISLKRLAAANHRLHQILLPFLAVHLVVKVNQIEHVIKFLQQNGKYCESFHVDFSNVERPIELHLFFNHLPILSTVALTLNKHVPFELLEDIKEMELDTLLIYGFNVMVIDTLNQVQSLNFKAKRIVCNFNKEQMTYIDFNALDTIQSKFITRKVEIIIDDLKLDFYKVHGFVERHSCRFVVAKIAYINYRIHQAPPDLFSISEWNIEVLRLDVSSRSALDFLSFDWRKRFKNLKTLEIQCKVTDLQNTTWLDRLEEAKAGIELRFHVTYLFDHSPNLAEIPKTSSLNIDELNVGVNPVNFCWVINRFKSIKTLKCQFSYDDENVRYNVDSILNYSKFNYFAFVSEEYKRFVKYQRKTDS